MSSTRQRAGRSARDLGSEWESLIAAKLEPLASARRLVWRKNPKQVRTTLDPLTGSQRILATGKGPPDFTIRANGTHYELEAKATGKHRWPFQQLKLHQALQLDSWQAQGAVCGLLINIEGIGLAIPWQAIAPRWWSWQNNPGNTAPGTASMHASELRCLGVELDLGGTWLAWLSNPTPKRVASPRLPQEDPCQRSMF